MNFEEKDICYEVFIDHFIFYNSIFNIGLFLNKLIVSFKAFINLNRIWKTRSQNLPIIWKSIDLNTFKTYKPFFLLNNLIKLDGKFRRLLKNIISEPIFLIFSYLTIKCFINNFSQKKVNVMFNGINIKWFMNLSKKLKFRNFTRNDNRKMRISKKKSGFKFLNICPFRDIIVEQAIYIVLKEIYENKLMYFSERSYGFRTTKFCHTVIKEIKIGWQNVNWYVEFDIRKAFTFLNKIKLVNQLKKEIQDQSLFLLLFKLFKIQIFHKKKVLLVSQNNAVVQNNILSPLFLNIYLSLLDFYVQNFNYWYNKRTNLKKKFGHIKANIFCKNKIKNMNKFDIRLKKFQFRSLFWNIPKKMNDLNLVCLKFLRYTDIFVIGVLAKKKLALRLKNQVMMWIESELRFEVNIDRTMLTSVNNDVFKFLGIKIYCAKTRQLNLSKSKVNEKKLRIMNRIKIKKNIVNDKVSKSVADLIWNKYRKKLIELSSLSKNFNKRKNKKFESEIIEILEIQKKHGIRFFAEKLIEIKQDVLSLDPISKSIFKQLDKLEKILFKLKIAKKKIIEKIKRFTLPFNNKFIVNQIIKKYGDTLNIIFYDTQYFCNKINRFKFKVKWPKKILKSLNIANRILFKVSKQDTNEKKLFIIINYLEINQFKINFNNQIIKNFLFSSLKEKIVSQNIRTIKLSKKLILSADLYSIYKKFWENGIIKPNKMKACAKFKLFSCKEYEIVSQFKIIALGFLNYYQYCVNYSNVTSIIDYFFKQCLTLKYKYKAKYIQNKNKIKYSFQRNRVKVFLSLHEINFWKNRFKINDNNIIFLVSFESMYKIYIKKLIL